MRTGAVIVAAGRGVRMGGMDKCALAIAGRSLLSYSVAAMAAATDTVVVVVAEDRLPEWQRCADAEGWPVVALVAGGETRGDSVQAGFLALRRLAPALDTAAIHDGARPLVSPARVRACLLAAAEHGAAILAAPVTDTIKRVRGVEIVETLDRASLWAAQTPQCFRAPLLAAAFAWMQETGAGPFTDEAGMVEAHGHPVVIVPGDPTNLKVTTPGDLHIAAALLRAREEATPA